MKGFVLNSIMIFTCFSIYSQKKADAKKVYDYVISVEKKWDYFVLTDTITVKIVNHIPAAAICGYMAFASNTIVETENGEIIRILDLCNLSDKFKVGQILKIAPDTKPNFDVSFPFDFVKDKKTKQMISTSKYDLEVLKTTWGKLIEIL